MNRDQFAPDERVLSGETADVYFLRTREAMQAAGVNPTTVMEVVPARDGLLCGMRGVRALLSKVLPRDAEVWALAEGDRITAKEVVLRIKARYLSYGIYETAILGMLASALFVGSSFLLSYQVPPLLFHQAEPAWLGLKDLSLLGLSGCTLSLLVGLRLLRAIGKSGHLDQKVSK